MRHRVENLVPHYELLVNVVKDFERAKKLFKLGGSRRGQQVRCVESSKNGVKVEDGWLFRVSIPLAGLHELYPRRLHSFFWLNFISESVFIAKEKPDPLPKLLQFLIFFVKKAFIIKFIFIGGRGALLFQ